MKVFDCELKPGHQFIQINSRPNNPLTFIRAMVLLIFLLLLMGCSLLMSSGQLKMQQQDKHAFFELMPPPEILQNRVWLDKFTISFDNAAHPIPPQNMLLQTEITDHRIIIAAMSFEGIPLAQASWNATTQELLSDSSFDKNFNPKQVLQDLQSVNWPLPLLKKALFSGFAVDEEIQENIKIRNFYHNGKIIVKITKQADSFSFEQIQQGYRLTVIRLQDNVLSSPVSSGFDGKN